MAKRWYVAKVVGTGTNADPFRPKGVMEAGVSCVASIATNPITGAPALPWCLVKIARASGDFTDFDADTDLDGFPLLSLDTRVNQLPAAQRNRIAAALTKYGIDTSDVQGTTTLRQIVRRIGRLLEPGFHEDVNDVSEA